MTDREHVEIRSRAELRAWLSTHHAQTDSIWLVHFKKHTDHYVAWGEIVKEALCWGWVDGQVKRVDDDRIKHLLSPRRARSHWSAINKRHVVHLEAKGLMTDAGRAVIERAKADGSWTWLDDVEALVVPEDLEAALQGEAAATWDGYPDSEKKRVLFELKSAKRPATREKRLAKILANAHAGKRTYT